MQKQHKTNIVEILVKHYSRATRLFSIALLFVWAATAAALPAKAQSPIVNAILFYSPTCPHCHIVIEEAFPPLLEKFGEQLIIVAINVQSEGGNQIFSSTLEYFGIAAGRAGVPMLVVGDTMLMGSLDIPEQFPGIIENGLIAGGIDWPEIPGLDEFLLEAGILEDEGNPNDGDDPLEEATPSDVVQPTPIDTPSQNDNTTGVITDNEDEGFEIEQPTVKQLFMQDVEGNSLSVLVLVWMIFIGVNVGKLYGGMGKERKPWPEGVILLLFVVGLIVSVYLGFVEMSETEAVCGPVGDCNTVQQSPYATLFGLIPIGVLGVIGYFVMGFFWIMAQYGPERMRRESKFALFGLTAMGMLFSIYLTFLEPFVIGATCAWCLTSAVVITLLTWNAAILVFDTRKLDSY